MTSVADEIRNAYSIGFVPAASPHDGRYDRLRVAVDAPGAGRLKVRTRGGYVAGRPVGGSSASTR